MSQGDSESRFTHLLQPIRDLEKNWAVDIASYLEEYLDEITFDNGNSTMNFIEAAVLIQGSACVYSHKVEYLYSLVLETLNLVVSKKNAKAAEDTGETNTNENVRGPEKQTNSHLEELCDISHLFKLCNPFMKDQTSSKLSKLLPSVPTALIKTQQDHKVDIPLIGLKGEDMGSDFKLMSCRVHSSGVLLLEPENADLMEDTVLDEVVVQSGMNMSIDSMADADLISAMSPARPIQDVQLNAHQYSNTEVSDDEETIDQAAVVVGAVGVAVGVESKEFPLHDTYSETTPPRPFLKGRGFIRVPRQLLQSRKRKADGQKASVEAPPPPLGDVLHSIDSNPACVCEEWATEFDRYQTVVQETVRRHRKMLVSMNLTQQIQEEDTARQDDEQQCLPGAFPVECDEDDDAESNGGSDELPDVDIGVGQPWTIEDIVRDHLVNAEDCLNSNAFDIAARVNAWHELIQPRLLAEENQRPFDIERYREEFLQRLQDTSAQESVSFAYLMHSETCTNVCRYFISALHLVNAGNVHLSTKGEMDDMALTLLTAQHQVHADGL